MHLSMLVNQRQQESKWDRKEAIRHSVIKYLVCLAVRLHLKSERDTAKHAQPTSYPLLFQIDFAQAISSNQGLIELTQKEKDGFGIVPL